MPPFAATAHRSREQTTIASLRTFAWTALGFNVLAVLWGAYVRASGSGAGCGSHWPLCNGEVVPASLQAQTLIEFTHRVMSGIALIAVAGLWFWCRRVFPKGSAVSRAALLSLAFLLLEALLGAGLVLFQYVGGNVSTGRAIYLAAHLTNTQLLLACLTATAYLVGRRSHASFDPTRVPTILKAALSVILLVSITGVIAALGDTLYPSTSLAAGLRQDFSGTTSLLLRLRALHPALAIGAAAYLVYAALRFVKTDALQQPAIAVMTLAVAQLCAGAINVALLAPIWMQIVHLLLADLLWIALVLVGLGCAAGDYAETRAVPAVL